MEFAIFFQIILNFIIHLLIIYFILIIILNILIHFNNFKMSPILINKIFWLEIDQKHLFILYFIYIYSFINQNSNYNIIKR
jgi:hypothetical protein